MEEPERNVLREMRQTFNAPGAGPADRLVAGAGKTHRVKVFKSGNSLALRLPKALGLEAGMEMELRIDPDGGYDLKPVAAPKRKINVDAFWGICPELKELTPEDRVFEHRELDWHLLDKPEHGS